MTLTQTVDRAERLVSLLDDAGVGMILVTDLVNLRYLTGYTGSNGLAVVGPQTRAFITDFRYVQQSAREVDPSFDRRHAPLELVETIEEVLPQGQLRLGFEANHVTVLRYELLRAILPARVELVAVEGLVERLRAVKEPQEVERIREAAKLADAALSTILTEPLVGRGERQVALALDQTMREAGAGNPSFDTIVASGAHGALPHARPRGAEISAGELVVIDWGAELDGYCSDCTRTVAAGEPGASAREVYELVLAAQRAGVAAVRAGEPASSVDARARDLITDAGYGNEFGHGLGHGVGLAIHEGPRLSQRSDAVLAAGNVVTVEPGIYLPARFGVRIEDLVVVREDGCEILSSLSKELIVTS